MAACGRQRVDGPEPDYDGAARLVASGSPLLDRAWLRHAYGLTGGNGVFAQRLVFEQRLAELAADMADFSTTPLFDPAWVRRQTGAASGLFALLERYVLEWERAGVSPNLFFPPGLYAASAGAQAGLLDFVARGQPGASVYFDDEAYVRELGPAAPVLAGQGLPPFAHYVVYGWREGRAPNRLFDAQFYAAKNRKALGGYPNGFSHFLFAGDTAGLPPNPFFSPDAYLAANPDLAASGQLWSAFHHLWHGGRHEGWRLRRQPNPAALAAFTFLRDKLPCGPSATALLSAGREFGETGLIPAKLRSAAARVLRQGAQPVVAIDQPELPEPVPGEPPCHAFLTGIAVLPFHALNGVLVRNASPGLRARVLQVIRVTAADYLEEDPFGLALHGELRPGFLLELELQAAPGAEGHATLELCFSFAGTDRHAVRRLDIRIGELVPQAPPMRLDAQVCLAAYAPPAALFGAQARSVLDQVGVAVRLLVSDDATPPAKAAGLHAVVSALWGEGGAAVVSVASRNRGFVGNFERALRMAPVGGGAVLLSDQDDRWYPDKVATLLAELAQPGTSCAFSDMRIVDEAGAEISPTFWRQRGVHHRNPVSLAIANTVTGAAAAVPAALLPRLLPFPRFPGVFHDMWLSAACSALGRVAYVDRPLYDYIQHGGNQLGFWRSRRGVEERWRAVCRGLHRMAGQTAGAWSDRACEFWLAAAGLSRGPCAQRWVLLSEALRRIPAWHDPAARADAELLVALLDRAAPQPAAPAVAAAWRRVRQQGRGDAGLLGLDHMLAACLGAQHLAAQCEEDAAAGRLAHYLWSRQRVAPDAARLTGFERALQPVPVRAVPGQAKAALSFTLLLPHLRLPGWRVRSFVGELYVTLVLADRLERAGHGVRLLLLEQAVAEYEEAAKLAAYFPELEWSLGRMELLAAGADPVPFGPLEAVVATGWMSAHAAHGMALALGRRSFVYLIQSYEPDGVPHGAWRRGAEQSYRLPHHAVYAGETLAAEFRARGLSGLTEAAFDPPLETGVTREPGAPPTLLFYACPGQSQSMYDLGLAVLRQAVRRLGPAAASWRFLWLGAEADQAPVPLGDQATLRPAHQLDTAAYRRLLGEARIGLALLDAPHLGLVPVEMAAAGLQVITTACGGKTGAVLDAALAGRVSGRLIAVEPSMDAVTKALLAVMTGPRRRLRAITPGRAWPADPASALPPSLLAAIVRMGEASLNPAPGKRR